MKTQKSIPLAFVCFGGIALLLASIAAMGEFDEDTAGQGSLPLEIESSLTEFNEAQRDIELSLQRFSLGTLDRPPEERRDLLAAWMESNRPVLEAQVRRADELDALFYRHGIDPVPDELAAVEAQRPQSAAEAASPKGRLWAFQHGLAELRQRHEQDPERLRDALHTWHEANLETLRHTEAEMREEFLASLPLPDDDQTEPEMVALVPPADAPEDVRRLFDLQNALADAMDADPSPLHGGQDASFEEMDAWRERISRTVDPLVAELHTLNRDMTEKTLRRVASEARHETTR